METFEEHYASMRDTILKCMPNADMALIDKAVNYARVKHRDQLRKDGSPYIIHPLAVAEIVAEMGLDIDAVLGALLHDCIEDTDASHADIEKIFGQTVAELVEGVTKLTKANFSTTEQAQMENLRKMFMAMSKDIRVVLIKIADRLHNMRTMQYQTPEKQLKKCQETMDIYAPLAHRLGMQKVKWELEDTSLRYLNPKEYNEIMGYLNAHKEQDEAFMHTIQSKITERLSAVGIRNTTYGRIKHVYSIYRKMKAQNKSIDELYDIYAFRVIVDSIPDCYNVLGHIHDLFNLVPGRFKDYISTPKPNMDQSLHTTVIGSQGIPFEVQIRTWEMHETAEYGIAAHWKYKQGTGSGSEKDFEWVRRLLENQQDTDAEDYVQSLKIDMFDDEVFVFTPKGRIVSLPAGSTPIDFAYAIHSAVGNHMVGAKVNGRIVTFDHVLKNGDIVEIMTSKAAKGPSRDWMKMAKSSEARSKIRQWFKKEKKEENIINGRSAFEAELKHCGLSMKDVTDPEMLPTLLKKVSYPSLEDMYAAIGYGGFTAQKAVSRMQGELQRIAKQRQIEQQALEAAAEQSAKHDETVPPAPKRVKSEQGIIVEGLDNCLVKFSKCCTPVPGDSIVGFITRGYGVSVHRVDCPNAAKRNDPDQAGRWIKVSWGSDTNESYPTILEVICKDRANLLLDISAALSTTNTYVLGINTRSTEDGYVICRIEIRIRDEAQLRTLMNKLNQISGVLGVTRPAG